MNDETNQRYIKLANYFYKHHMGGAAVSVASIRDVLVKKAVDFRPDYFRVLKNALFFDLESRGHSKAASQIKEIVNPVTAKGSTLIKKPKLARVKKFSDDELAHFATHLVSSGCYEEFAAISLIRHTGARPAELHKMQIEGSVLFIEGAKKTDDALRGADRVLTITDPSVNTVINDCIRILQASDRSIDAIRHRLRIEAREVWPRRKVLPSMYSVRHQVGAHLKASSLDPKLVAYIMGHQSTNSMRRYGDKRQGSTAMLKLEPAKEADLSKVRNKIKSKSRELFVSMLFEGS